MKTIVTREAAAKRAPRTTSSFHTATPPARPLQSQADWAWPGLTRAELREHVIEQIG